MCLLFDRGSRTPLAERVVPLALKAVDELYEQEPGLARRDGSLRWAERLESMRSHLLHLAVATRCTSLALYREHLRWCLALDQARGRTRDDLAAELRVLSARLARHADSEVRAVGILLDAARAELAGLEPGELQPLARDDAQGRTAALVLDRLLARDATGAEVLVHSVSTALPRTELYARVLTPVLHEIGRLWQVGSISAATEHRCTADIERILDRISQSPSVPKHAAERHAVVACTPGEEHSVGARMIADLLVSAGWQVHHLGEATSVAGVLAALKQYSPDLLVVSIVRAAHLCNLRRLVRRVRQDPATREVRVLVGGAPFARLPELRARVPADAVGTSLDEVLPLAERLVAA